MTCSSGEETQETYDPSHCGGAEHDPQRRAPGQRRQGGVPGTSSNLPNAKVSRLRQDPTSQSQSSKSESGTYGVNKLVRHTIQPAGQIKRIAAALLVDDAVEVEQKNNQRIGHPAQAHGRTR